MKGAEVKLNILSVIFSSLNIHRKQSFARATFRFIIVLQPFLYAFLLFMMYKDTTNSNIGEQIFISSGLMTLWSSIIFSSAGDIERERYMGTLEFIYASPSDFRMIFLGKVLGNMLLGIFSMLLSLLCVTLLFGQSVQVQHPLEFILAFILAIVSFAVISLLAGLLFTLSRNSRILMNCLEYPIYILCGIVFPISILPGGLQFLSYLLSPTWAVELLRSSMIGIEDPLIFYGKVGIMLGLTGIYLLVVLLLFNKIDVKTRIKGTLGVH